MKIVTALAICLALGIAVAFDGCSLFTPAAPPAPPTPPVNPAAVVQKVIQCVSGSVMSCMANPPPLNNPQYCMTMAGVACAQAN